MTHMPIIIGFVVTGRCCSFPCLLIVDSIIIEKDIFEKPTTPDITIAINMCLA